MDRRDKQGLLKLWILCTQCFGHSFHDRNV